MGRPTMGRASGAFAVWAAPTLVPTLWDSYRAGRFCGSACPADAALSATDRPGLPVDADESRGRAARGELGRRAPGRTGVSRSVGSCTPETSTAAPRGRRDPARQGPAVLDRIV